MIRKLLIIVSRPARLLECLEFDPQEFYHFLEVAEGEAKITENVKTSIPQYIISKLGLNEDPLKPISPAIMGEDLFSAQNNVAETSGEDGDELLANKSSDQESVSTAAEAKPPSEDDYEIVKLISNGAYGAVYLVRHIETRQRFAMKKINKHNLVMRNQVEQVFAERDIMSFTDNPFVVSMLCSFETRKHLCMVMEYVEGGDCATLLKHIGPFPLDLARLYFAETVLAVEYLHSFGIVHRDLKPDNLLITALGHIKLTDFGLSKMGLMNLATSLSEGYYDRESHQFTDKQIFGTPEYLAPEVILKQGYAKTVDWWSLGVILYEFLIGCVPFFGDTPEELFAHVINDSIEWPDEDDWPLSDESKDIITHLLEHNPFDRLGAGGAQEVKIHPFFDEIDWNSLLRQKAEFVPQLDGEDDTSYFDTRLDRYNHESGEDSEDRDTDDSSLFGSFSSCSPRYHRVCSRVDKEGDMISPSPRLRSSTSSTSLKDVSGPSSPSTDTIKPEVLILRSLSVTEDRLTNTSSTRTKHDSAGSNSSLLSDKSCESIKVPQNQKRQQQQQQQPASSSSRSNLRNSLTLAKTSNRINYLSKSTDFEHNNKEAGKEKFKQNLNLPKFSFSIDDTSDESKCCCNELDVHSIDISDDSSSPPLPPPPKIAVQPITLSKSIRSRSVIKSASASGLSLIIPSDDNVLKIGSISGSSGVGSGASAGTASGGSNASSRDASPNREVNSLALQLKPPIILRKGPGGFGFNLKAIRVYHGETDYFTVNHLVHAVKSNSPAFESGLRPGDLITHINSEPIQGLLHHQVRNCVHVVVVGD